MAFNLPSLPMFIRSRDIIIGNIMTKFLSMIILITLCTSSVFGYCNSTQQYQVIILAAGKGTRMQSTEPKVLTKLADKSMLEMTLLTASKITNDIVLVYSPHLVKHLQQYKERYKSLNCVLQDYTDGYGTAAAIKSALGVINKNKVIVVLYADTPLITADTIETLVAKLRQEEALVAILGFEYNMDNRYGKIITNQHHVVKIVEWADADEDERRCNLCNSGIMAFNKGILHQYIPLIKTNKRKDELYLTDIVSIVARQNKKVTYLIWPDYRKLIGINTPSELENARSIMD